MNYGLTNVACNARDALIQTAQTVMEAGDDVSPRGKLTRELRHYTVVVLNPRDWSCAGINAAWSAKVAAVEAVQLIGGFSDASWTLSMLPNFEPYLNPETKQFDGAYGRRTGLVLHETIRRLQTDPDTRQAIVPIFTQDDGLRVSSLDYPCTLNLHFLIRNGKLDLDVTMRSNDVNWGFKHDVTQFCLLQITVAQLLGIDPGIYTHTANSMHLYEESFDWVDELYEDGIDDQLDDFLQYGDGIGSRAAQTYQDVAWRARCVAYDIPMPDESDTERYLRKVLHA